MKLVALIEYLRSHLKGVVRACLGAMALLVVADALPVLVDKEHAHTWVEKIPGFWSIFGLLACLGIIVVSKAFGHSGVMKREDYYDE